VVSEDGVPQTVRSFTEHGPLPAANLAAKLPPNTFTNYTPVPDENALTVILIDALDANLNAQMYLHEQLIEYLQKAKPVSPIAIFLMDARMNMVQGFTTDTALLLEAVKSKRCWPVVPFYSGAGEPVWMFKRDVRTGGMQMLGRYLAGFPGRKNVIWFTGFEPHKILFNTVANNAFPDYGDVGDAIAEQAEALRLSRISIYR
jgi:VWFA-related protein